MSAAPAQDRAAVPHQAAVSGARRGPAALVELRIRDLGVIRHAVLTLGDGLTVLSGETGAGKTMVVTAVTLLFGGRADAHRVRPGADQATIDGRLALPPDHPAVERVRDAGGELDEDGTLTLRRTVSATGRSRAFAGGAPVPIGVLADVAGSVLAVHGQTDQLRLTRPAEQRAALDRFAAAREPRFGALADSYTEAFVRWRAAAAELRDRRSRTQELRREAELLRHGLAEVDAASLLADEDVELSARESRLAHLDGLREAARAAHDALLGDADDPLGRDADVATLLGRARWALDHVGADAETRILDLGDRITGLAAAVTDVGAELSAYLADLDAEGADPLALARVQERRHAVAGLVRTYGDPDAPTGVAGVLAWATQARDRLDRLDVSDEALAALATASDAARSDTAQAAAALTAVRTDAAAHLSDAVTTELAGLAMASAAVDVVVSPRAAVVDAGAAVLDVGAGAVLATADGVDDVAILLRSHPGAPALPVHRGASGGELSRVMLGLEAVLAATEPVPLLVFDEVDAGVGGRAAVEVGARLARLAAHHQVLVVTHLAQVAAAGDAQVAVARDTDAAGGAVSRADVVVLAGDARVAELARMLAGQDTPTARRHAEELLCHARPSPTTRPPEPAETRPPETDPTETTKAEKPPPRPRRSRAVVR